MFEKLAFLFRNYQPLAKTIQFRRCFELKGLLNCTHSLLALWHSGRMRLHVSRVQELLDGDNVASGWANNWNLRQLHHDGSGQWWAIRLLIPAFSSVNQVPQNQTGLSTIERKLMTSGFDLLRRPSHRLDSDLTFQAAVASIGRCFVPVNYDWIWPSCNPLKSIRRWMKHPESETMGLPLHDVKIFDLRDFVGVQVNQLHEPLHLICCHGPLLFP